LKTIAAILVRELSRKLGAGQLEKYAEKLGIYKKVLSQKKDDKDKIYALHALEVSCIAKGKEPKKYEFGSKVSVAASQKSNIILAVKSFKGNPNDNKTLDLTLEQQERMTGVRAKTAIVDRGYKSQKRGETQVFAPSNGAGKTTAEKAKARKYFRRRAAIEPVIGHLKSDFGMGRNYLKGEAGDEINAILAASAFNFKSWLRKSSAKLIFVVNYLKILMSQADKQALQSN
jgi:transposase, IS5 family